MRLDIARGPYLQEGYDHLSLRNKDKSRLGKIKLNWRAFIKLLPLQQFTMFIHEKGIGVYVTLQLA